MLKKLTKRTIMKWRSGRKSSNVDDRRGMSGGQLVFGGGVIGVVVLLVSLFTGTDLTQLLNQVPGVQQEGQRVELSEADKEMGDLVSVVFGYTEDVWHQIFRENNLEYREPKLVLFTDAVQSACGGANSAVGPFYCPGDETVYMDLSFFNELQTRFGAKGGDFAIAYVIAHEVGHHVQNLLGTSEKIQREMRGTSQTQANQLSVSLELQADFYAGVWAHYKSDILDEGDIEEALSAANAVGDDAIQRKTQGQVVPDGFTHGTSAQRMYWFTKGFKTGDVKQGNTLDR